MRFFMAPSIPAGKVLKVNFDHIAAPATKVGVGDAGTAPDSQAASTIPVQSPTVPPPASSRSSMPAIVGIGSVAALIGGTLVIFTRPTANHRG